MSYLAATNKQVPDHAILDAYNKQVYLGNQYFVSLANQALTSSESNLLLIQNLTNGTGVGKGVFLNLKKLFVSTASSSAAIRIYINPTVTANGSAATLQNSRPSYGTASALATVTTSPTTSANGTLVDFIASTTNVSDSSSLLTVLDPGQAILVTGQGSGSISVNALIGWYEL